MEASGLRLVDGDEGDDELVRHVVRGSDTALAQLYDRHAETVFRVALSVSRDRGVAEEVVQETFLALWNKAELFDPALGSLSTWLSRIARNRAVDRLRFLARRLRAAPFSALAADQPDPASTAEWLIASGHLVAAGAPEPEPEVALARSETGAMVATALATLTGPEQQAVLLAYRDGLTQSEIAAHLGWPLGTVKTRSRRALHRLRDALEWSPAASVGQSVDGRPDLQSSASGAAEPCSAPC